MLDRTQRYKTLRFIQEHSIQLDDSAPDELGQPGEFVTLSCEGGDLEVPIDDFEAAEKLLSEPRLSTGDLWITLGGGAVEGHPVFREAIPHGAKASQIADTVIELEMRYSGEIIRSCEDEGKVLWDEVQGWPDERLRLEDQTKAAEDLLRVEYSSPELRAEALDKYVGIRERFHHRVREMQTKSERLKYLQDFREEMKDWHGELGTLDMPPGMSFKGLFRPRE